jgi:glycosyltransferase involved in cell wall biosynthesis
MRVLYVNHTSQMSGAEQSLLVLLRSLPDGVEPVVACPEGPLAAAVRDAGVTVHAIPGTDLSARLHPWHTPRELARVLRAALGIRALAQSLRAEAVHANTPRAALMCLLATAPAVVHVRDRIPPGRLPVVMFRLLARNAAAFIATSQYLADELPDHPRVRIVANAVEGERFDPGRTDRAAAREMLGLKPEQQVIAVVGQISPHKGQREAIEILHGVRHVHPGARLLLVGSVKFASAVTRFDNRGYEAELSALARRLGLDDAVLFLGERADVAALLAAADVLLVPSWYEPFGRVAIEAMMMEVPVVATSVGGTKEVVRDGVDGVVLPPRAPALWTEAVIELLGDPQRRAAMGRSGRARVRTEFAPESHAGAIADAYRELISA